MARDMVKKNAFDEKWKKENTLQCGVRIQNSTGIPNALERALTDTGVTKNAYIIAAIREKLTRDGYLKAGEPD